METTQPHAALDLWAPRRQATLAQARKRSDLVRLLRMLFIAGAAIALGIFGGHILRSVLTSEITEVELTGDEIVTMKNARFSGRDAAGQAYIITATEARRRRANSGAVDLLMPVLTDEKGGTVRAPSGFYDRDTGILELYEDVNITDAAGYSFNTSSARIYVGEGRVDGLEPLSGSGPLGDIRCDSYEILDDGDRVICQGNVQMTIYPQNSETETPEEGAGNEG